MNKSDAWKKRPVVLRYFKFKDELRYEAKKNGFQPSDQMALTFYIPVSQSWSKKKKEEMNGQPHRLKPDLDNLDKAFKDALIPEDCTIWHGVQKKFWTTDETGWITAEHLEEVCLIQKKTL